MSSKTNALRLLAFALPLLPATLSAQHVIDFRDVSLPPESSDNGASTEGGFSSGGAFFHNVYQVDGGWISWGGFALSNVTDNATPGWENQYAAIAGPGLGATGTYAIGYVDNYLPAIPRVTLPEGRAPLSIRVTNTAYAYYSIRDGDAFGNPPFGDTHGNEPDYFYLTITGRDAAENPTGSLDVYLADYRFSDNSLDYILDSWTLADLSGFAPETRHLDFTLTSSDVGILGMNTPAYFALGEITVIPEPKTYALATGLFLALTVAATRRLRTKKTRP